MELREKLRLALAAAPGQPSSLPAPPARPRTSPATLSELPAQLRLTDLGEVYVAEERWPLDHRHGNLALSAALAVGETAVARLAPGLNPSDLARAAFLDVETTGLAGGTGTLAFLVGVATFEDGGLCLRQFFLTSPGGEEALLAELSLVLAGCRAIVSFNGRCFDVPLLESRFVPQPSAPALWSDGTRRPSVRLAPPLRSPARLLPAGRGRAVGPRRASGERHTGLGRAAYLL